MNKIDGCIWRIFAILSWQLMMDYSAFKVSSTTQTTAILMDSRPRRGYFNPNKRGRDRGRGRAVLDTINCDSDADCIVICIGFNACHGANINGPQSANRLTVICYDHGCILSNITGASNSELYIECRGRESCGGIFVNATSTTYLSIFVTQNAYLPFSYLFGSAIIYCPTSQLGPSCLLRVSGLYNTNHILRDIRIFAKNGFNDLTINCEASQSIACFNTSDYLNTPILLCGFNYDYGCFTEPKNITNTWATDWDCNQDSRMTHIDMCSSDNALLPGIYGNNFVCDMSGECSDTVFHCYDGDCTLRCIFHYSCRGMTIYAPQNGNLNVLCATASNGNNERICYESTISAPMNGTLNVICDDNYGRDDAGKLMCAYMYINASNAAYLNITVITNNDGAETLHGTSIYCPETVNSCSIHASGSAKDMLGAVSIYAPNAFYSLSLSCDYTVNVSQNCYTIEPRLHCNKWILPSITYIKYFELAVLQ